MRGQVEDEGRSQARAGRKEQQDSTIYESLGGLPSGGEGQPWRSQVRAAPDKQGWPRAWWRGSGQSARKSRCCCGRPAPFPPRITSPVRCRLVQLAWIAYRQERWVSGLVAGRGESGEVGQWAYGGPRWVWDSGLELEAAFFNKTSFA